jgi:hypothetical protein
MARSVTVRRIDRREGTAMMKLSAGARRFTRKSIGLGRARSISPDALEELARRETVVVIGVGIVRAGTTDPRLPGEQRIASLLTLARTVEDLPRQRAIVLHCG